MDPAHSRQKDILVTVVCGLCGFFMIPCVEQKLFWFCAKCLRQISIRIPQIPEPVCGRVPESIKKRKVGLESNKNMCCFQKGVRLAGLSQDIQLPKVLTIVRLERGMCLDVIW